MSDHPLVSIGVPIYNDAPWLRNALDHLLDQDYPNLEINIADNCSTDGSREILREYALRDQRIHLFENKYNIGMTGNHRLVHEVSQGDYFMWGSGHDYFEPTFVSRIMEAMQANPSVVLCCVRTVVEDANKKILSTTTDGLDTRGLPPVERFRCFQAHQRAGGTMNIMHGLFRSEKLLQLKSSGLDSAAPDAIWLGELSLLGEFFQLDEVLHHRVETWTPPEGKDGFEVFDEWLKKMELSQANEKKYVPRLNMVYEYQRMIDNSRLSSEEKECLWEDIQKIAEDWKPTIQMEIDRLVGYSLDELSTLKPQPGLRKFRAMQILSRLDQAYSLGFDRKGMHQARSLCLAIIGHKAESRAAARAETKTRLLMLTTREGIKIYLRQGTAWLHKLLGDKTWQSLKKILRQQ